MGAVLRDLHGKTHKIVLPFNIGRAKDNRLRLDDPQVAEHVGLITREDGRFVVKVFGDVHQVRLNHRRVVGKATLRDDDRLEFGPETLRFELKGARSRRNGIPPPVRTSAGGLRMSKRLLSMQRRFRLTPRETEILGWLAEGKTNAEIAVILGVKFSTIKTHVERILAKLGVENRHAAMRMVLAAEE